jgi:benzoylformate decarboxylase
VVLNNGGYGAMRAFSQLMKSKDPPGIDLPLLDFIALAHGHGCNASRVSRAADLAPALREAFATPNPTLVEVIVDRTMQQLFRADWSSRQHALGAITYNRISNYQIVIICSGALSCIG